MEKQNFNQETNLLSENEKLLIKAQEQYRREVSENLKSQKPTSSKSKIWNFLNTSLGIWLLSTVVVGFISWGYKSYKDNLNEKAEKNRQSQIETEQQKQKEIEKTRANASMVTSLLPYLASNEEKQWRMAIAITGYLKSKGELPQELELALGGIVQASKHSDTAFSQNAKAIAAVKVLDTPLDTKSANTLSTLPPRVYIQISNENQRDLAKSVQKMLGNNHFIAPGVENVGEKSPKITEVRYFNNNDKNEAINIIKLLKSQNIVVDNQPKKIGLNVQNVTSHYEIWFAKTK